MKQLIPMLAAALVLTGGNAMFGQAPQAPRTDAERAVDNTKARTKDAVTSGDVTYGKVKELTPGNKVVIAIDNSPDKNFDLADKDLKVNLGKDLKVGDMVKVDEKSELGVTKAVTISKHSGAATKK